MFLSRRWQESAAAFTAALEDRPGDEVSRAYLGLSQKYQAHPPDASWRGIRVHTKK